MDFVVAERYQLLGLLGEGGMGEVWRGLDTQLNRPVAVKLLRFGPTAGATDYDELVKRFRREAQAVAALNHPNIVTAYDFGVDPARRIPYLVMEFIDGRSLLAEAQARAAAALGPFPLDRVLSVGMDVCAGLAVAHEVGVVHRDLKPANLMTVTRTGRLKIVDFGIARGLNLSRITRTGGWLGTVAYMAPEQLSPGEVDGRADLYALGCVLFELLTEVSPYEGTEPAHFLAAHVSAAPRPLRRFLPDAPAALEALILDLLAKRPDDRPATTYEVATRLAALAGARVPAGPTVVPHIPPAAPAASSGPGPVVSSVPAPAAPGRPAPVVAGIPMQVAPGGPVPVAPSPVRVAPGGTAYLASGGTAQVVVPGSTLVAPTEAGPPPVTPANLRWRPRRALLAALLALLVVAAGVGTWVLSRSGGGGTPSSGGTPRPSTATPHPTSTSTAHTGSAISLVALPKANGGVACGAASELAFSSDASRLASADGAHGCLWNGNGRLLSRVSSAADAIAYGPNDNFLVTGGPFGARRSPPNLIAAGHALNQGGVPADVESVAVGRAGTAIAVTSRDSGVISIVDSQTGAAIRSVTVPFVAGTDGRGSLSYSRTGRLLVRGEPSGITVVEPATGQLDWRSSAIAGGATATFLNEDLLYCDGHDLYMVTATGQTLLEVPLGSPLASVSALAVSGPVDGHRLLALSDGSTTWLGILGPDWLD